MFWFFGRKACGILAPQPGIEPTPPALEGEVLTTGPPGKSPPTEFKLFWKTKKFQKGKIEKIREVRVLSKRIEI